MILKIALTINVVAIGLCLTIGVFSLLSKKAQGSHTELGEAYHLAYFTICVSALFIVNYFWQAKWWAIPTIIGSYGLALVGYIAAKVRFHNWLKIHLICQSSSFIMLLTITIIVYLKLNWIYWALPTLIGIPIIASIYSKLKRSRRMY